MDKTCYTRLLQSELIPALGCTEPISLAYAAAECRTLLGVEPDDVLVRCSGNMIKNVMGVTIPNTGGMKGIEAAVAAGMMVGDSSKGLEILSAADDDVLKKAKQFLAKESIVVKLLETDTPLHLIVSMSANKASASVEIRYSHMNIVRKERNGVVVYSSDTDGGQPEDMLADDYGMSIGEIIGYCENIDIAELSPIIEPQLKLNSEISEEGLHYNWGAEVGRQLLSAEGASLVTKMKSSAAAGSDARMSGCVSPVIINSGSGNQGITASIPVKVFAEEKGCSHEALVRAVALSNLVSIYERKKIGRLSAFCGVVNASSGVSAAITWLSGGDEEKIGEAVSNTLAISSGMLCDGAKPSCAAKIAIAIESAYIGYVMAMNGKIFASGEGIVKESVDDTINGVAKIASEGMKETDKEILSVMLEKASR